MQLYANIFAYKITPSKGYQSKYIKILDAKELNFSDVHELSGLAYEDDTLYALSDRGILYLFNLNILHNKIENLSLCESYRLRDKKSQLFKKKKRDSEGLVFYKDGFLISFEGKNRILYCSRKGQKIKNISLPKSLQNDALYVSKNKGLESVAYSKEYGIITAPELPLKNSSQKYHTLYSKKQVWKFIAQGAITDICFIDRDRVLVLLREFSYLTQRRVSSLVIVNLKEKDEKNYAKTELLVKMDSADGWKIDNFEGLTKVGKKRFLMVSDDNDSFFQKTLLVLFEIKN